MIRERVAAPRASSPGYLAAMLSPLDSALRSARRLLLAGLAILASGCMTAPPPDPAQQSKMRDAVELAAQLLAIADIASSAFTNRVAQLRIDGASDMVAYTAETIRNNSVANFQSIALSPDPASGLVNMYVYANLGLWGCENRVAGRSDLFQEDCDATYGLVLLRVKDLARQWMTPAQIEDLDRRIEEFKERYPGRMTIGSVRLEDLDRQFAQQETAIDTIAPSLFSPVTEAAEQLEQVRLLGDRAIWLMSRLPEAFGWRLSAFLMEILASDGFTTVKELASSISQRLQSVHENIAGLERSMGELGGTIASGSDVIGKLDQRIGSLGEQMAELDAALAATGSAVEGMRDSIAPLPDRFRALESSLAGMNTAFEDNVGELARVSQASAAMATSLQTLDAKVDGLQTSIAGLTREIETLEGAKSIIDDSLLKAAGLGALLIVFAGVSRYAVHHLTKAK